MYIRCPEGLLCYSPQTSDTMAYFILDRGVFQILLAWSSCTLVRVCRKIAFPVPVELSSRRPTSLKTFEALNVTCRNLYYAILLPRTLFFFFLFFFNSYYINIPQTVSRPSNEILNRGISNLSHDETFALLPMWISIATYLYRKPIVSYHEWRIPIYWFVKHSIKIYIVVHPIDFS